MKLIRLLAPLLLLAAIPFSAGAQEVIQPTTDSTVNQKWVSEFGFSFLVPAKARFNKLGSNLDVAGQTQTANFILPGACGAITIQNFKEGRMVPQGYRFLDSVHVWDKDSTGRNGIIHRRIYILTKLVVQIDILLTDKGNAEYGSVLPAILDSFVAPEGAEKSLPAWRYGRSASEFERGKPPGSDDSR